MDDNPQTTPTQTPPAAAPMTDPAPVTPPMGSPMASYPRQGTMGSASQEEKGQATLIWVLSIFFGFIPALIFYLIAKDKPFVHRHSAMALALTIVTTIGFIASAFLMAVLIGFLLYPAVGIFHLVICIKGAMEANKGNEYDPPIAAAMAKSMFGIS